VTSLKRVHEDAADGQVWRGIGVSSGRVTAVARAIRHPDEGTRLDHGEILLAPSTDPGWTPLFLRASAMVMETGGYLSHGVIVAREYGLPGWSISPASSTTSRMARLWR
jgi:pyruvate,water dikinase